MTTIDSAYRSPEEDAAYFASIWGLSQAKMQVLEKAFRDHERNAPPRTAVEGVRRLIRPNIMLTASEVHVDGFERKAVFNALTYLTRTGELAHAGYGKYQAPPADFVPEPPTIDSAALEAAAKALACRELPETIDDYRNDAKAAITAYLAALPSPKVEATEPVKWPPLVDLGRVLSFFASVIKSGEPWTSTCQDAYEAANQALKDIYAERTSPSPGLADEGVTALVGLMKFELLDWNGTALPDDGPTRTYVSVGQLRQLLAFLPPPPAVTP